MAQIVAKAMAKGAECDKLAAEFADELDTLGVRVAKLEKGADAVKIAGQIRARYKVTDSKDDDSTALRTRLWINGQVNDDWSYTGMLQATENLDGFGKEEKVEFQRAYLVGKVGGLDVTAGRYNAYFGDGYVYDTRADAIEATYGLGAVKVTGFYGKATDGTYGAFGAQEEGKTMGTYTGVEASTSALGLDLMAGYANFKDMDHANSNIDNAIWWAQASKTIGDFALKATYIKGDAEGEPTYAAADDDGYAFAVSYKGVKASVPGSWGVNFNYWNQGGQTHVAHTTDAEIFGYEGFKGYGISTQYALAKNIVLDVAYYDTESKTDSDKEELFYADVYFTF